MPQVYTNGKLEESDKSEEELEKSGLQRINTLMHGFVWAAPEDRQNVLKEFRAPSPFGKPLGPPQPKNVVQQKKVDNPPPPKTEESNKSSAVPKKQMDEFVEGLVEQSDQVGFPVYSVCDNNSFHTSGYLWGYYAALMVKKLNLPKGPIAVVNFDSHVDAGQSTTEVVASDRWGSHLIKAINELGFPACYLSTFNRNVGKAPSHFGSVPAVKKEDFTTEEQKQLKPTCDIPLKSDNDYQQKLQVIREQFQTFWGLVQRHFDQPIRYVFFTIDRDVLDSSYTQWGNGKIVGTRQLLELMEAVLEPLNIMRGCDKPGAKLIGFDITGMPESKDLQVFAPTNGYGLPPLVWSKLSMELYDVLNFVHSRLNDVRQSVYVSHVIFFSGSISYTAQNGGEDKAQWKCWHYVSHLAKHLKLVVASGNAFFHEGWSYMLCQQAAPIYEAAWKQFTLYKPEKPPEPCKPNEQEQLEEKMKKQLGEGTPLGGFACTAGVSDASKFNNEAKMKVSFTDMVNKRNAFAALK